MALSTWNDIPQFIPDSDYNVHHRLSNLEETLREYDADYGLNLMPDYQRGHVWTESQQIAYVGFFLQGGRTARIIYFNVPRLHRATGPAGMELVDGLQRITALRRFLNNEFPVMGMYYKDFSGICPYTVQFNINSLQSRAEVLRWYLQINQSGTPHTPEELARVNALLEKEFE